MPNFIIIACLQSDISCFIEILLKTAWAAILFLIVKFNKSIN